MPRTIHHVYILACSDGTLYTGYTTDVERRVAEHNAGEGARYTRGRGPVEVVYVEDFDTCSEALQREYAIKQLQREEKERLIDNVTARESEPTPRESAPGPRSGGCAPRPPEG